MNVQRFFMLLLLTNVVSAIILLLLMQTTLRPYTSIGWLAMMTFSILSIIVFFLIDRVSQAKKKTLFIQIILANMMAKFACSVLIAGMYYVKMNPTDGVFILPFIIVYIVFTVFETYYMDKQART